MLEPFHDRQLPAIFKYKHLHFSCTITGMLNIRVSVPDKVVNQRAVEVIFEIHTRDQDWHQLSSLIKKKPLINKFGLLDID